LLDYYYKLQYSPDIQIKLIYLDSEMIIKIQQFQLPKMNKVKQHDYQSTVYTVSPVPHQKPKALMD